MKKKTKKDVVILCLSCAHRWWGRASNHPQTHHSVMQCLKHDLLFGIRTDVMSLKNNHDAGTVACSTDCKDYEA